MHRLFLFFLLLNQISFAQPNYGGYDKLLQKHVSEEGKVNYKLLKTNKLQLDSVVKIFQATAPQTSWPKNEQLAYWLNAYNLFTLQLMTNNFPVSSITKLDNGKPWDVKRIEIGGKKYALNEIENDIIRPQFKDPRIHFALNCAAKSCPPLHNEAFTAANVQTLLEQRTRKFVRSSANTITTKNPKISKIFDWYAADFGNPIAFLNKYAKSKIASDAKIEYAEYDWRLND